MRRYLRPRRQTPEAGTEEQPAAATLAQDLPQETQTPAETEQPEEIEESRQLEEVEQFREDERLEGAVTVTSEYVAKLERESEDANLCYGISASSWSGSTRYATNSKRMHVVSASCASDSNRA